MTHPSPESEVLLCVARRSLTAALVERLKSLIERGLDWESLLVEARNHGLVPLLFRHLNGACPERVPPATLELLKQESLDNSRQCLYLFSELQRLLKLFAQQGLTAVPFKGPLLSWTAYGDLALRSPRDLDILIPPGEFKAARDLLDSAGYQLTFPLSESQQEAQCRSNCELLFVASNGRLLDLHWGLNPKSFPMALDTAGILERREHFVIQGASFSTFAAEDMVFYLCYHGSKHYWCRLEWVSCLAEFIRANPQLGWATLVARAKESRGLRMLALGLLIARDLCDLELPEITFLSAAELALVSGYAKEFEEKLLNGGTGWLAQGQIFRYNLKIMDRKSDAFLGLLRSMLLPTISDWQAVNLPRGLHPLYYVLRPIRLVYKRLSPT